VTYFSSRYECWLLPRRQLARISEISNSINNVSNLRHYSTGVAESLIGTEIMFLTVSFMW